MGLDLDENKNLTGLLNMQIKKSLYLLNELIDVDSEKVVKSYVERIRFEVEKRDEDLGPQVYADGWKEVAKKPYLYKLNQYRKADFSFFDRIRECLAKIPVSNGSRFYKKQGFRIGLVSDQSVYDLFRDTADFFVLTPDTIEEHLDSLQILMIVSTESGIDGAWDGLAVEGSQNRNRLLDAIAHYKNRGVRTVYYSLDDTIYLDAFLEIAKACDSIFTTALEKIPYYKRVCQTENVFVLLQGVDPVRYNPIGIESVTKEPGALYAGEFDLVYPERTKDMTAIFNSLIDQDCQLKIIDDHFLSNDFEFYFPKYLLPFITPYSSSTGDVNKLFDFGICISTVKLSKTIYPPKVLEWQACGNLMLTNYSLSVNTNLPDVFIINKITSEEAARIMTSYTTDEKDRHRLYGIRNAMNNTSYKKMEQILNDLEINCEMNCGRVAVIAKTKSKPVLDMFTWQLYDEKVLFDENEWQQTGQLSDFEFITFFDETSLYEEYYLLDMINAFKYTDVDFVTKESYYCGKQRVAGRSYEFVDQFSSRSRTVFSTMNLTGLDDLESLTNGFSTDRFEYDEKNDFVQNKEKTEKKAYKFTIGFPIYNNGKYLQTRSFHSLLRSSMFADIEILLVDDGSTDGVTPVIVNRLARQYDNVTTFLYEKGGSGSASRPRNKAIEMATTEYIGFLDPDDEAVNDGFAKLYHSISANGYDVVSGKDIGVGGNEKQYSFYKKMMRRLGTNVYDGNKVDFLLAMQLYPLKMQDSLARMSMLKKNNLRMVEGALGQDTVFSVDLAYHASVLEILDEPVCITYTEVEGSVTNTITKRFFYKYLLIEKDRVVRYEKYKILDYFVSKRLETRLVDWYLLRFRKIQEDDMVESAKILYEIICLYKKFRPNSEMLGRFIELCKQEKYDQIMADYTNINSERITKE